MLSNKMFFGLMNPSIAAMSIFFKSIILGSQHALFSSLEIMVQLVSSACQTSKKIINRLDILL
ncbi:MAG: hypothetical protein O7G88_01815, partial [bacterium]|nr:hypothetical protein [bacterium]